MAKELLLHAKHVFCPGIKPCSMGHSLTL